MASMDFAYDLIEKLSEEPDNDYLILILRKGKKQDKVDLFYRFDQESKETLEIVHKRIGKILEENGISKAEEKSEPPKKKRGWPRNGIG